MSKGSQKVTKAMIAAALNLSPAHRERAIGRALVILFKRQTEDERVSNDTTHTNLRGFASCDAKTGCITAKYYIKHGRLENWQMERWLRPDRNGMPYITKYHRQLTEAAHEQGKL